MRQSIVSKEVCLDQNPAADEGAEAERSTKPKLMTTSLKRTKLTNQFNDVAVTSKVSLQMSEQMTNLFST